MGQPITSASRADLVAVSDAHVFFAHQSVGRALLEAIPRVYATHDGPAPRVAELSDADPGDRIVHTYIGENGDPIGKIDEYADIIRGGVGDWADVAILKLCYSDIRAGTDLARVLATHRETLAALGREYPDVAFIPSTVPLTTARGRVGALKRWLGPGNRYGHEDNVARDDFNALLRAEYPGAGRLFDIAHIESTTASGRRVVGRHHGRSFQVLDQASASDHGHLNEAGADTVARGLLAAIASGLRG